MSRQWVVNASPLIVLCSIGRVNLLTELCDSLIVPAGVADEVLQGDPRDPSLLWVKEHGSRMVQADAAIAPAISAWDLGQGETAVLSFALQNPGYEVIVDDRAARNCAVALGIPVRGTLGILLLAKKSALIDRVEPVMREIIAAGLHVHEQLYMDVLRIAGE